MCRSDGFLHLIMLLKNFGTLAHQIGENFWFKNQLFTVFLVKNVPTKVLSLGFPLLAEFFLSKSVFHSRLWPDFLNHYSEVEFSILLNNNFFLESDYSSFRFRPDYRVDWRFDLLHKHKKLNHNFTGCIFNANVFGNFVDLLKIVVSVKSKSSRKIFTDGTPSIRFLRLDTHFIDLT